MFIRKGKPAGTISRPTRAQQQTQQSQSVPIVKPLGGWDNQDKEQTKTKPTSLFQNTNQQTSTNLFGDQEEYTEIKPEENELPSSTLYSYSQLSNMDNLEHQVRLVQQIVQPGGIKIKPNQGMLNEFAQAAKTLDKNIIGSLLISKLEDGFPYAVKAKSLYIIEHLSKKNQTYKQYFQQFIEQIRAQPQPSDNVANYNKLLNEVLAYIQNVSHSNTQVNNQANLIEFGNGPDYNKDLPWDNNNQKFSKIINNKKVEQQTKQKEQQQKKAAKKFISPNQAKRIQKNVVQKQQQLISVSSPINPSQQTKVEQKTRNNSFNIFDLQFSNEPPKPASQPVVQPHPLTNLYQTPIQPPQNMNAFNQQQYQYQQNLYQQQQQQFLQQQRLNQQQQQFVQNNQTNQKPITGAQLYSLYK